MRTLPRQKGRPPPSGRLRDPAGCCRCTARISIGFMLVESGGESRRGDGEPDTGDAEGGLFLYITCVWRLHYYVYAHMPILCYPCTTARENRIVTLYRVCVCIHWDTCLLVCVCVSHVEKQTTVSLVVSDRGKKKKITRPLVYRIPAHSYRTYIDIRSLPFTCAIHIIVIVFL